MLNSKKYLWVCSIQEPFSNETIWRSKPQFICLTDSFSTSCSGSESYLHFIDSGKSNTLYALSHKQLIKFVTIIFSFMKLESLQEPVQNFIRISKAHQVCWNYSLLSSIGLNLDPQIWPNNYKVLFLRGLWHSLQLCRILAYLFWFRRNDQLETYLK